MSDVIQNPNLVFDFSVFREYQEKLNKIDWDGAVEDAVKEAGGQLLARAKKKTSPSTKFSSGQMRRSWRVSNVEKYGDGFMIEVYNTAFVNDKNGKPVPYPIYVEYGHRIVKKGKTIGWVPGKFWLRDAKNATKKELPLIIKKHMEARLNGLR